MKFGKKNLREKTQRWKGFCKLQTYLHLEYF